MASLNPLPSPNSGNKPWVEQIRKTLQTQVELTIDTPPVSIFEIPINLKAEKLEAYVPQQVGLGPYHHFQPELYRKMEQKKLNVVKRLLKSHQIQDYDQEIVQKIKAIVPIIRDSYDSYLDADDDTLAWLFAIDGMFLLDQIEIVRTGHRFEIKTNDFIMLENQIPLIVLLEIQKALWGENKKAQDQEDYLERKFRFICNPHSPFHLSKQNVDFSRVNHLLDYMYRSIVGNETSVSIQVEFKKPDQSNDPFENDAKLELLEAVTQFARLIPGAQPFLQILEFLQPKFHNVTDEKLVEEITVPSVSELGKTARVKFRLSPKTEGVRDIRFVVHENERFCYLPSIKLNVESEAMLRNLVAYEKLTAKNSFSPGHGLELTEYVDFMCGIIDNAKDVKLLREERIIRGDLDDEEIVKLFNGMGKSRGKMSVETELRKTMVRLNDVYESTPRIWVQRSVERQFRTTARVITFVVSFLSALVFVREVYLKVYGSNPPHVKLVRFVRAKIEWFACSLY